MTAANFLPLREVEDLTEPIRAWRTWQVSVQGQLFSLCFRRSRSGWSESGEVEAECLCDWGTHLPPGPPPRPDRRYPLLGQLAGTAIGYGCGIYACKDPLNAWTWTRPEVGMRAVGEVQLGGRVWEHTGGWRAQHARLVSVAAMPAERVHDTRRTQLAVARAGEFYGVPVINLEEEMTWPR